MEMLIVAGVLTMSGMLLLVASLVGVIRSVDRIEGRVSEIEHRIDKMSEASTTNQGRGG